MPVLRKERVLNGGVFLLLLGSVVQGNGESSDLELIALQQKQAGGTDSRKEYYMLSAVLGAFWSTVCLHDKPWRGRDDSIPMKTEKFRETLKVTSSPSLRASSVHCSAAAPPPGLIRGKYRNDSLDLRLGFTERGTCDMGWCVSAYVGSESVISYIIRSQGTSLSKNMSKKSQRIKCVSLSGTNSLGVKGT